MESSHRRRGPTRADQPSDSGFTLIELLVVVVIIGILAAIAVPVYSGLQRSSYKAQAQSWTTTATHMIYEYYLLNGVMPTTLTAAGVPDPGSDLATQFYPGTNTFCVSAFWMKAPWSSGFGPTADTYKDVYPRTLTPVNPESFCVYSGG